MNTTLSTGPADYIPKLHFAAMLAGEVDYDRFFLFTDILITECRRIRNQTEIIQLWKYCRPGRSAYHQRGCQLAKPGVDAGRWLPVAEGTWGNVDVLAGVRLLAVDDVTDFSLSANITRPDGSVALGRSGSLAVSRSLWSGIGGVRGRVYVGGADWFGAAAGFTFPTISTLAEAARARPGRFSAASAIRRKRSACRSAIVI